MNAVPSEDSAITTLWNAERFTLSSVVHSVDCTTDSRTHQIDARDGRILLLYLPRPVDAHKDNRRDIETVDMYTRVSRYISWHSLFEMVNGER